MIATRYRPLVTCRSCDGAHAVAITAAAAHTTARAWARFTCIVASPSLQRPIQPVGYRIIGEPASLFNGRFGPRSLS